MASEVRVLPARSSTSWLDVTSVTSCLAVRPSLLLAGDFFSKGLPQLVRGAATANVMQISPILHVWCTLNLISTCWVEARTKAKALQPKVTVVAGLNAAG